MNMEMEDQIRKRMEQIQQHWQEKYGSSVMIGLPKGELEALQWVLDTFGRKHN